MSVVFDITKGAVDMQFRIAERLDSKARNYFAAAATIFGVVQALTLNSDVRKALGDQVDDVRWLTISAAAFLVLTLASSVWAIRPRGEIEFSPARLRELLGQSYVDTKAPAQAINELIEVLAVRLEVNKSREKTLWGVVVFAALSALVSLTQLAFVVEALL